MTTTDPAAKTSAAPGDDVESDPHYAALAQLSVAPLWRRYGELMPPEPVRRAEPHLWRYAQLRPQALHFSEALDMAEAERRVLMLVNPALTDPPATVNTLFAGIQVLMPGETAQAHRHAAGAFRFVIEGSGAHTTVDGERVPMSPGDLVLTPGWAWHDHTHRGEVLMTWLDGLDYPLVNALNAGFFEPYGQHLQPVTEPEDISSRQLLHGRLNPVWQRPHPGVSPIRNYRWAETERALSGIADDAEGSAAEGVQLEYTNPWTGGPAGRRCPPSAAGSAGCAPGSPAGRAATPRARSTTWYPARGARRSATPGWTGRPRTSSPSLGGCPTGTARRRVGTPCCSATATSRCSARWASTARAGSRALRPR